MPATARYPRRINPFTVVHRMSKYKRLLIASIALWSLALGTWAWFTDGHFMYRADPMEVHVVDAATKQPLDNAIVVMSYPVKGGFEGGNTLGVIYLGEAVTGPDGVASFAEWGPRINRWAGRLRNNAPDMLVYRREYGAMLLNKADATPDHNARYRIRLSPDAATVEMRRLSDKRVEYESSLVLIEGELRSLILREPCDLRSLPRLLFALDQDVGSSPKKNGRIGSLTLASWSRALSEHNSRCKNIEEFVRRAIKDPK